MRESSAPRVEAVDRALALLLALADAGPSGSSLADLAEHAKVNKSTAYRALSTLRLRGFATQSTADGSYRLGPMAMELADRAYAPRNLAQSLHPALVSLSRATDELVHLGIIVGDSVQYLDKVEPEHAVRVWSSIGQLAPVATTSMGRALLAARRVPDQHLKTYLRNLPTGRKVSYTRLREAVVAAREIGYAVELGENEPDIGCIGVAIMSGDQAVAALSITALITHMDEDRQHELAALTQKEIPPLLPDGLRLMGPAE
jgi:DNA-binding IclR family transcriptional regulator